MQRTSPTNSNNNSSNSLLTSATVIPPDSFKFDPSTAKGFLEFNYEDESNSNEGSNSNSNSNSSNKKGFYQSKSLLEFIDNTGIPQPNELEQVSDTELSIHPLDMISWMVIMDLFLFININNNLLPSIYYIKL